MPLEKRCIKPGCAEYPSFGSGLPSGGKMRWACRAHRELIANGAVPAPREGGPGVISGAVSPPSQPLRQGRLF